MISKFEHGKVYEHVTGNDLNILVTSVAEEDDVETLLTIVYINRRNNEMISTMDGPIVEEVRILKVDMKNWSECME